MSTTALTGTAPQAAPGGPPPPSIPDLAHALIAAHTSGGHTDVQALATAVAQTCAQLGGHDPQALTDAVGDQLRGSSQSDASAFARAAATTGPSNTVPAVPTPLTADDLRAIMPGAGANADQYVDALNTAMTAHGIVTREQRAAFLAQVDDETGQLGGLVEKLNYSAARLHQVFPREFKSVKVAKPYAHHPEATANRAYALKGGNGPEVSGDGYLYRGRGFLQVTGRTNYTDLGFAASPQSLEDPSVAADTAAKYWSDKGLNNDTTKVLGRHAFNAVSKSVSGSHEGNSVRWAAYNRALSVLK